MALLKKKYISTLKLCNEILIFKQLLKNNNFVLFYFFQFFSSSEQLILNKCLKKYNLTSKIINKKTSIQIFKNTKHPYFANLCKNNLLLIYSKDLNTNGQEAIKELEKYKKLQLIASKLGNNLYRSSETLHYAKLSSTIRSIPLITLLQILFKLRINISFLKTL